MWGETMNADLVNLLLLLAYLAGGTITITLLVGWLLKHSDPPNK